MPEMGDGAHGRLVSLKMAESEIRVWGNSFESFVVTVSWVS